MEPSTEPSTSTIATTTTLETTTTHATTTTAETTTKIPSTSTIPTTTTATIITTLPSTSTVPTTTTIATTTTAETTTKIPSTSTIPTTTTATTITTLPSTSTVPTTTTMLHTSTLPTETRISSSSMLPTTTITPSNAHTESTSISKISSFPSSSSENRLSSSIQSTSSTLTIQSSSSSRTSDNRSPSSESKLTTGISSDSTFTTTVTIINPTNSSTLASETTMTTTSYLSTNTSTILAVTTKSSEPQTTTSTPTVRDKGSILILWNVTFSNLTLPKENLLNIQYSATSSHYWYFANGQIYDKGSNDNFLIESLLIRYKNNSDSLKRYFRSESDVKYFIPVGVRNILSNFINDKNVFPGNNSDSQSLSLPGNGECWELFTIADDHLYNHQCLGEPDTCEYGFSAALWLKYNEDVIRSKDTLMASGNIGTQGFELFYKLGQLVLTVNGRMNSWTAQIPMNKYIGSWLIVGFSWTVFTGEINLLVGDQFKSFSNTLKTHNQNYSSAVKVNLGCLKDLSGYIDPSTTPNIAIGNAAMWMWPIRMKELLTSNIVYNIIRQNTKLITTTTTSPPKKIDFPASEELIGKTSDPNPFYFTSDLSFLLSNINIPRSGFELTTASSNKNFQQQINFNDCISGLSISFWIFIPNDAVEGDVFTIVNSIQISYSKKSFLILVFRNSKVDVGKRSSPVQTNTWQNVAFSMKSDLSKLDIYINGYLDNESKIFDTSNFKFPTSTKNGNSMDIIAGSGTDSSLVKGIISDIVIWKRYMFTFESHRFVGYSASQFQQLNSATNYWTTDSYIHFDSSYLINKINQTNNKFSLSSIIKSSSSKMNLEKDPYFKSSDQCPVLEQKSDQYLFLAKYKIQDTVNISPAIDFTGICFSEPSNEYCRYRGVTVSIWLKIKSVSFNKIQFFLNTRNLPDSLWPIDDIGIKVFVNRMLFCISLSTSTKDWDIILDSNKYKINEWMNIGILWREDIGIQMLINGVDYGLSNTIPTSKLKSNDIGFQAVIGRYDKNTWSMQSVWEFGNFVFGEMSYFDTYMTPDSYSDTLGLINNLYFTETTWLKQGASIIDAPIRDLITAKNINESLNYVGVVEWDEIRLAVRIISAKIPILVNTTDCPGILKSCSAGFSVGGWFLITKDFISSINTNYNLILQGEINSDGFGVQITNKNELYGWVQVSTSIWKLTVKNPILNSSFSEWVHIGLMWKISTGIELVINGLLYNNNNTLSVNEKLFNSSKILIGDIPTQSSSKSISIYNFAFYNIKLDQVQLEKLLGVPQNQVALLKRSTLFWTVYGLYYKLTHAKVNMVSVNYGRNKYDTNNAAACTNGADQSYVTLEASNAHCLNQPDLCQSFVLVINIKIYPLMIQGQDIGYILLSGQDREGYTGVTILQTSDKIVTVELRNLTRTCKANITNYTFKEWSQLQLIWNVNDSPTIRIDDLTQVTANCFNEKNRLTTKSDINMGRHPTLFSVANQICVSELMITHVDAEINIQDIMKGLYSKSCYVNLDMMYEFNQQTPDQNGVSNSSAYFKDAVINTVLDKTCLNNPGQCSNGLTISFWVMINSITMQNVPLFSVGQTIKRGIDIKLQSVESGGSFGLEIRVATGHRLWTLSQPSAIPKSIWTNIGVTWSSSSGLGLFINGKILQSSPAYSSSFMNDSTLATTIDIGKQIDGNINDLAIWYKVVASCANPQLSHKILNGFCSPNKDLPLQEKCSFVQDCRNISGNICLDENPNNVIKMAESSRNFTSPDDVKTVLTIVNNVLKNYSSDKNLTKASVKLLLKIADNMVIPDSLTNYTAKNLIDPFVNVNAEILLDKYQKDWMKLQNDSLPTSPMFIKETDKFYLKIAKKLDSACDTVTSVRINFGVSMMNYNSSNSKCGSIQLPNYENEAWTIYPKMWLRPINTFTINQSIIKDIQPNFAITSSIFNNIGSFPTNPSNLIPRNFIINSQLLTISTTPEFNNTEGQNLVKISLQFIQKNTREGVVLPWFQNESRNPDLKYKWVPAFWNEDMAYWDGFGCTKQNWNSSNVIFFSNHFTSFVILMEPVENVNDNMDILNIITYTGLSISAISLLIFIITIAVSKNLRGPRYTIHLNLSCSLFIACISFLLIGPAQENQTFCRAIGIMMHLFFLGTFSWMFFEALYVFYAVTAGVISSRLCCFYPIGWGIPIIIVGTTAGLNVDAYGRNSYCWLSQTNYYLWSFLGPILGLILATIIICLIVACNLNAPAVKGDKLDEVKDNIKQTAYTIPLMLCAWLFGALYMITWNIPIAFIFVIFCSLQGLWVLIFFGFLNPDFRYALCRKVRKKERPTSAVKILNGIESEYGSDVNIQNNDSSETQPKAPFYYVTKPKPRPPKHVESVESLQVSFNSQKNLINNRSHDYHNDEINSVVLQNNGLPENFTRSIPGTPQYLD